MYLPISNKFDLQLQLNTLLFLDSLLHQFHQSANIFSSGIGVIDEKISMQRADLSVTDTSAFQSACFDQLSGVITIWVFEHRTHAGAWGLSGFAVRTKL